MKHTISVTLTVEVEFSGDIEITPIVARALKQHADFILHERNENRGPAPEGLQRIPINGGRIDIRWKFKRLPKLMMNMANWHRRQRYKGKTAGLGAFP